MKLKEKLSMPCTGEQWIEEIAPRLMELGVEIKKIFSFERNPILVNNWGDDDCNVGNILKENWDNYDRLYIPYDADRFINSFVSEYKTKIGIISGIAAQDLANGEAVFLSEDGAIVSSTDPHIAVKNVTHKFEGKTTTGYDIEDIIEWNDTYIVKLQYYTPKLFYIRTLESVNQRFFGALIPRNPEKDALKQQIEEKESELKELKDKLDKL